MTATLRCVQGEGWKRDFSHDSFQYRSMKPGRGPIWNVIADVERTTWLEPVQFASDDRLLLPINLRKRVSWCEPATSLALLATIGEDGGVTVMPISEQRHELAAIRSALEVCEPEERAGLAYAAMATYSQISLQPDGRLRLSPPLTLHLCKGEDRRVWVGAHNGAITLWSERDWASHLERASNALREALAAARESA